MKLTDLLNLIDLIAKKTKCSKPYLCGGLPRDKVAGIKISKVQDIDITTGDDTIKYLADEVYFALSKKFKVEKKQYNDGHITIYLKNIKIDFSSNFNHPNIDSILKNMGIENPTSLQKEVFSRDFTCNSLLIDLQLKEIKDLTGRGVKDIKEKKIRTILSPEDTFNVNMEGYNSSNRIVRAIYLSSKLGFELSENIKNYIRIHPFLILRSEYIYISRVLKMSLMYDPKKTAFLLKDLNLANNIPLTKELLHYLDKKAQLFTNYDYTDNKTGPGSGFYKNMDKYKSVTDFRNKRMKRRKKNIQKILKTRLK